MDFQSFYERRTGIAHIITFTHVINSQCRSLSTQNKKALSIWLNISDISFLITFSIKYTSTCTWMAMIPIMSSKKSFWNPSMSLGKQYHNFNDLNLLFTLYILCRPLYPFNELHYIDFGGMVSREAMALLRIKHFVLPKEADRHQSFDILFPDPMAQISMINELHVLQELIHFFGSRLERDYSSDLVHDTRQFERRSTLSDPDLRNALAVRISEKKMIIQAQRTLINAMQRLNDEISNLKTNPTMNK